MFEVGRLCVKLAGRDAGSKCVIVEVVDEKTVLIDGQSRRRKCNVAHLEPLADVVDIKSGADHDVVVAALEKKGVTVIAKKAAKKGTEKPKKQKVSNKQPVKDTKQ